MGTIMTISVLSDEVLFETKVHCLYLLDQFNKPPTDERRIFKHGLKESYKKEIINAGSLDEIQNQLTLFRDAIESKKGGLLIQKVDECLNLPSFMTLATLENKPVKVMHREFNELYSQQLKSCIPLLEYSLSHPEHPIRNLINDIRNTENLDSISILLSDFKDKNVKPRSFIGSIFSRDSLPQHLDKAIELVNSFKEPVLKNES